MSSILDLHTLLIAGRKHLDHAEKQLLRAIPKIANTVPNAYIKAAFTAHFGQTRRYLEQLAHAMKLQGIPIDDKCSRALPAPGEEPAEPEESERHPVRTSASRIYPISSSYTEKQATAAKCTSAYQASPISKPRRIPSTSHFATEATAHLR